MVGHYSAAATAEQGAVAKYLGKLNSRQQSGRQRARLRGRVAPHWTRQVPTKSTARRNGMPRDGLHGRAGGASFVNVISGSTEVDVED